MEKSQSYNKYDYSFSQSHFSFKGCYYDQTDGVAMGSPLAPVLANLCMRNHKKKWLNEFSSAEVLFYRQYVDDKFCVFDLPTDAELFFQYINSRHTNIRFTMEKEHKHILPFLDVLIDNEQEIVITKVFSKTTFTGLFTNFFSFTFHFLQSRSSDYSDQSCF